MEQPGPDETLDRLVGDWHILQLRAGHRFSTDDLLTAYAALRIAPGATRLLDIGAGIGSVGLMTLHGLPPEATLTMVEAQAVSHELARRTVALNGLSGRVEARLGDLRDEASIPEIGAFDLVTGSPPYIPLGKGVVSPHPQRAGARMELRGDVFDYCRAAARAMTPDGHFAFCHAGFDPRPEQAIAAAGLVCLWRQDVIFRHNQAPTIALYACARQGERADLPPLQIRDEEGRFTETYQQVRAGLGAIAYPFRR